MIDASDWTTIHQAARDDAGQVVSEHAKLCSFFQLQIEQRLRLQEQRFYALVGFMVGGGFFGGVAGGALVKLLGG